MYDTNVFLNTTGYLSATCPNPNGLNKIWVRIVPVHRKKYNTDTNVWLEQEQYGGDSWAIEK